MQFQLRWAQDPLSPRGRDTQGARAGSGPRLETNPQSAGQRLGCPLFWQPWAVSFLQEFSPSPPAPVGTHVCLSPSSFGDIPGEDVARGSGPPYSGPRGPAPRAPRLPHTAGSLTSTPVSKPPGGRRLCAHRGRTTPTRSLREKQLSEKSTEVFFFFFLFFLPEGSAAS